MKHQLLLVTCVFSHTAAITTQAIETIQNNIMSRKFYLAKNFLADALVRIKLHPPQLTETQNQKDLGMLTIFN